MDWSGSMKACSAPQANHATQTTGSGGSTTVMSRGSGMVKDIQSIERFCFTAPSRLTTSRPATAPRIGAAMSRPPHAGLSVCVFT